MENSQSGIEPRRGASNGAAARLEGRMPSGDRVLGTEPLDRETRVALLEDAHDFPGPFRIVVIARAGEAFLARLEATVASLQGDEPYTITERPSRKGTYVSYRVEVHVGGGQDALDRKDALAGLPGVVTLL